MFLERKINFCKSIGKIAFLFYAILNVISSPASSKDIGVNDKGCGIELAVYEKKFGESDCLSFKAERWSTFTIAPSPNGQPADAFFRDGEAGDAGESSGPHQAGNDDYRAVATADEDARIRHQVRKLQVIFQALNAIDAVQTIALSSGDHRERNPLYGKNPSVGRVLAIKGTSAVVHQLISNAVLNRSPRAARQFETISIAIQGGAVLWNLAVSF